MADRGALKLVGFIFVTATLVVMLIAGMVVRGYADGGYTLEASTVDLATEFTNLITTQRAYSASARIITTANQMLQQLEQLPTN